MYEIVLFSGAEDPDCFRRDWGLKKLSEPEFLCTFGGSDGGMFQAEVSR